MRRAFDGVVLILPGELHVTYCTSHLFLVLVFHPNTKECLLVPDKAIFVGDTESAFGLIISVRACIDYPLHIDLVRPSHHKAEREANSSNNYGTVARRFVGGAGGAGGAGGVFWGLPGKNAIAIAAKPDEASGELYSKSWVLAELTY
jgi:hypothetical protein